MNRLPIGYPTGQAGAAPLFLRLSLGAIFASASIHADPENLVYAILFAVFTVLTILGFATRSTMSAAIILILISGLLGSGTASAPTLLACAALGLFGAGGYSLDGVLFGRRVIIMNDHPRHPGA